MKGISSLLIAALVVSVYGDSLEKSEWEYLEKLRQEHALRKEKVLSFLREIGKEQQTANEKYNEFLTHSKNREVEDNDRNIEKWRPGIPPNILSLIKRYKQNSPNGDDPCKGDQNKNQKKDDSDETKDSADSNAKDVDGDNSNQNKEESSIKDRCRRSAFSKNSSEEDDDSNSIDDNSSSEESRRSHRRKVKSKEKNSDESNSDDKSNDKSDDKCNDSDSDEKNPRDSRKDKPKKKNSDESDSDNKSDDSDSSRQNSKGFDKNSYKEKNSNDSDNEKKNSKEHREHKSNEKNSDESNSDDKSDNSDDKSKRYEESENSSEEKKWRWILNRGNHQANNKTPAPWNWQPDTNWKLEAKRGELKSHLIRIAQLEKVIKLLKNMTGELTKRGQWEGTPGLVKAIAVNKKLLAANINAVSRICNITEDEPNKISELIIKCIINYSPRWRKEWLQGFLAAHPNLNKTHITEPLNKKGFTNKDGEQANGTTSSKPNKTAPPSDNAEAIEEKTSLNSKNSSNNKKNDTTADVHESAVSDKDQAPKSIPKNETEDKGGKNLKEQPGSDTQVEIKPGSRNAGDNGVNVDESAVSDKDQAPKSIPTNETEDKGGKNLKEQPGSDTQVEIKPGSRNAGDNGVNVDESAVSDKDQAPKSIPTNKTEDKGGKNLKEQPGSDTQVEIKPGSRNAGDNSVNVDESEVLHKDQAPKSIPTNEKKDNEGKNLSDQPGSGSHVHIKGESSSGGEDGVNPLNNENEIPGSNDDQPANDDSQPQQSVPKSNEPKNLDLEPKVSSSNDNTAKVVAIADNNWLSKKLVNDINKLGDLNIDQIAGSTNLTELLAGQAANSTPKNETDIGHNKDNSGGEVGESSTDSNNQITTDNQTDTTLGNNETSDNISSQTGSTTSQPEQSSGISETTATTEPRSTSTLSTEGTTDNIENASSESDSIFNTTAPKSTSLMDE